MRRFIWLATMMLLVALSAGQTVPVVRAVDPFTDPNGHFSFTPPDGYQQYTTQQVNRAVRSGGNALGVSGVSNDVIVAYRSPSSTANANVGASMLPDPNATVDDAVTAERDVLGSLSSAQITVDDTQETTLGGESARSFTYALSLNGVDLRGKQFIALHNGSAYFVTFTALAANADNAFADMQGIVDSFMFLD